MEQFIILAHVVAALVIIGLILIQQGKGADAGVSMGGGSSNTVFGAAGGGNLLTRMTAFAVAAFFVTSIGLAIVAKTKAEELGQVNIDIPQEADASVEVPEVSAEPEIEEAIPE